jgi:prolyl oligopeptidase
MTESGYPRILKRWRRGTPLADAETIFEGSRTDVSAGGSRDRTLGFERTIVGRSVDFWNTLRYELRART